MKPHKLFIAIAALTVVCAWGRPSDATIVRFNTSLGNIDVRLYDSATPLSVANFLNYATTGRYEGTFIHRVPQIPPQQGGGTSNFVVQGGGFLLNNSIFAATGIETDPPIGDEPGLTNVRGTLAFAKNSLGATSQWFFNIGNNAFLDDQDFTVFGRVLGDGMDIVDEINNLRTVNASAAANAAGEDFDEVPVTDFDKVIEQNDITDSEAVLVNGVLIRSLSAGDYNFDGAVDAADYAVWKTDFGSLTRAEADGNGDGIVNGADYTVWRDAFGVGSSAAGAAVAVVVPEPTSACLLLVAGAMLFRATSRRGRRN